MAKSLTKGGLGVGRESGGIDGAAKELWWSRIEANIHKIIEGGIYAGAGTKKGNKEALIEAFIRGIEDRLGYNLWLGYYYYECVVQSGETTGLWERKGPKYVRYTQHYSDGSSATAFGTPDNPRYPHIPSLIIATGEYAEER